MAKETLYCELGNHKWNREATRGRKPTSCPKHKPAVVVNRSTNDGVQTLHCEIGNHDWERPSVRGVKPRNCSEHKPVAVTVARSNAASNRTLHCEIGNHDWERAPQRGRVPSSCPEHKVVAAPPRNIPVRIVTPEFVPTLSEEETPLVEVQGDYVSVTTPEEQKELLNAIFNPVKRGRGRPKLYESEEEQKEAALAKSRERVNELEQNLKARGTHLSQQIPYRLFRLLKGTDVWEFVEEHSPLRREQFLNEHESDFLAKRFKYERDGELVNA